MSTSPAPQAAETEPEIPSNIARRKPVALTPFAAEDGKAEPREGTTLVGASGKVPDKLNAGLKAHNAKRKASSKAKTARQQAEKLMAGEPLKGMTAAEIDVIRSKSYEGAPAMDATLGDMTPKFVNWLFKNHPKDAAVRYAYRDIWPTE
jgi:hypothetical protein